VTEHTIDSEQSREFPLADDLSGGMPARMDEFDQELGRQMGRDAQRVADGDLSEEAFYEKYHEDVLEEFGEDNRPGGSDA
jgi:hypothetical protein